MFGPRHSLARPRPRLFVEELESRTLLSASILGTLVATPQAVLTPASQGNVSVTPDNHSGGGGGGGITNPTPIGYSPSQVQNAYGFNQISFASYTGSNNAPLPGAGQTIAIVDAYNDPNIKSDLSTFDIKFGLPSANLTVVNQNGGSRLPLTSSSWSGEISLDVEWAHAIAPGANILLVEASSTSLSNLMTAVNYAKTASVNGDPVSVVSMSWGGSEFSSELAYDSTFTTPGNNVTFVASSGDSGKLASGLYWPAASPNVVAVGGTSLTTQDSSGTYGSEAGWSDSTGGYSLYETQPGYQTLPSPSTAIPNGVRMAPDVAYNADPGTPTNPTGFAIYDTVPYYGQTGWFDAGGTSAGAPQWSALVAIADQGRALQNSGSLASSGTLYALYQMADGGSYSTYFHDVTSGSNGYSAGTGYDLVTGLGSPVANQVIGYLLTAQSEMTPAMAAPNRNGSTDKTAPAHASVVEISAGPASPSSLDSGTASFIGQAPAATAAADPAVLIQPAQTSTAPILPFGSVSVISFAFGSGQTSAVGGGNSTGQTSSSSAAVPGFQLYGPARSSAPNSSASLRNSLSPLPSESPDGVPLTGADDTDDLWADFPLGLHRTILASFPSDIDLDLAPAVPAQGQSEETPACDACFLDEANTALVVEETMASANGESQESPRLHAPGLALLGVLASSFWMAPAAVEESRRRHRFLL